MNRLQSFLLPGSLLALAAGLLTVEAWWLGRERQQARHALAALEQGKQERARLSRRSPAIDQESEQGIRQDIVMAQRNLTDLRLFLTGPVSEPTTVAPPATATEAYFDLAAFVERMRQLALDASVLLRPDERFAFGLHRHQGPEAGLVPAVFRQRQRLESLLETLIEARPQALLAVQRERLQKERTRGPGNLPERAGIPSPSAGTGGGPVDDFFTFDGRLSLRLSGQVEGDAFRLEFTGQTQSLRAFLNRLADSKRPFFVRSVETEPLGPGVPAVSTTSPPGSAPVPLVAQNFSRFTVVVECLDLAPVADRRSVP